ncbi:MAG: class D sortase [Clostridiales bacterium]|jgi:sortase A|nr:class D sortase [Clostridiales bacterium]
MLTGITGIPAYAAGTGQNWTSNADLFEYNYQFNSGPDTGSTFGTPTETDAKGSNPLADNIRRNKDVALLPPGYGIYSGQIPTDPSSPLHPANPVTMAADTTYYGTASVNYRGDDTGSLQSTSLMQSPATAGISGNVSVSITQPAVQPVTQPILKPTTSFAAAAQTIPSYYDDGSIGYLSIPAINTYVKVYEGETTANMKLGAAHFEFTSAWDGTVGLAGHNRGAHDYFKGVKDIMNGDLITYETRYGTRTYEVYLKEQISDTDFSYLGSYRENTLVLITCVMDSPSRRWVVCAREFK